jgi:2-aminoadipate transaminase
MDELSIERFRSCVNSVLVNDAERALGYDDSEGYAPFRRWVASYMNARGVECSEENILIVAGYQQGLALVARALLDPADTALVEDPTFPDTPNALRLYGATVQGIPLGETGPDVGVLTEVVSSRRPKLICVTPLWQNPTGIVMSRDVRKALLALAEQYGFIIVEDGFTDEFCYSGRLIPPLSAEDRCCRVVYVGSMSKLLFGGLRLGWVVASKALVRVLTLIKQASMLCHSPLLQAACHQFCELGYLENHIVRVRKILSVRRDAMVQAMEEYFPDGVTWRAAEGGLSTWVTLPRGVDSDQVAAECARGGAVVAPGRPFSLYGRTTNNLRMSYSLCREDMIRQGVKIVGDVLKRMT